MNTTAEFIKREADEITARTGRYIPPYRMANIMNTAQKVMKLVVQSDISMTYEEIQMVLDVVKIAVGKATGEGGV